MGKVKVKVRVRARVRMRIRIRVAIGLGLGLGGRVHKENNSKKIDVEVALRSEAIDELMLAPRAQDGLLVLVVRHRDPTL